MESMVQFYIYVCPLLWGLYVLVYKLSVPIICNILWNLFYTNWDPFYNEKIHCTNHAI